MQEEWHAHGLSQAGMTCLGGELAHEGPDSPPMKYTSSRKMVGMDRSMGTSEPVRAKKKALSLQQHQGVQGRVGCRQHRCALYCRQARKSVRQVLEALLRTP